MARLLALLMMLLMPAIASAQGLTQAPQLPVVQGPWSPASQYVTAGQDEPGYRSWYLAAPAHRTAVTAFNTYLTTYGVGGIVPTWQLLRTATAWVRCGAEPFEVPPTSEWPHIVQTLRYINDYVVPAVGPVEPVSAYRNPMLNVCAGGAPESAHKHYSAIDLVPLRPTTREVLMHTLCAVHARRGPDYGVGLGFYAFLRFHVDTTKFRRWGADPASVTCPPIIRPEDVGTVALPPPQPVSVPIATKPAAQPPTTPPTPAASAPVVATSIHDPLAPAPTSPQVSPH
jgi:hypothetical protein